MKDICVKACTNQQKKPPKVQLQSPAQNLNGMQMLKQSIIKNQQMRRLWLAEVRLRGMRFHRYKHYKWISDVLNIQNVQLTDIK